MEILTKTELAMRGAEILQRIHDGAIFIHPSDTIYGLGCNALDEKAVAKIRKLKQRPDSPFSIWAPSLGWISKNCIVDKRAKEALTKLPGPYTLILPLKEKKAIAQNIHPNTNSIGIRYPDHWFSAVVEKLGFPIVTTSANRSGQPFMTSLSNLDFEIQMGTEFIIYEGEKEAKPSQIIDTTTGIVKKR